MNDSADRKPEAADYPPLDFTPEVGMRIYRDALATPVPMMLQPNHGEQIKIAIPSEHRKSVTQPENITTETFESFMHKFRPTVCTRREQGIEILEVGKGDKDGLILIGLPTDEPGNHQVLLFNEEAGDYKTGWVSLDDLAYDQSERFGGIKWKVSRRHGNPLTEARVEEILSPDSDLKTRGQHDEKDRAIQEEMRCFVLKAVKAKYGDGEA